MNFEKKVVKTEKINLKGLELNNGIIMDVDGVVIDLNKVVKMAFEEGNIFDFTVQVKTDDVEFIEEDGEASED